jgi:hypothetical protein
MYTPLPTGQKQLSKRGQNENTGNKSQMRVVFHGGIVGFLIGIL